MADLSGIPKSERELYGINEEQIRRLKERQKDLMALKEDLPKTDRIGRGVLQKEYGKINRWIADLKQAPETFVNVSMEGLTDKKFGEAIHTHTRRVMDRFRLDTRPSKQGGSSIHHGDSTMQTLGAVDTAPTGMRRDIIEGVKDQGKELATGLRGLNFFDVDEATHPLYHPGEGGKVDYKNRLSAIMQMPSTATFDERMAALKQSTDISTAASEAADASPLAQARQTDLLNRARSTGGGELLDVMGNPFDRANPLRTTENIGALRKYISLSFKSGTIKLIPRVGVALTALGALSDAAAATTGSYRAVTETGKEQTAAGINAASGILGLASLAAPPLVGASAALGAVGMLAENRIKRDKRRERDTDIKAGRIQPKRPDPYTTTITKREPSTLEKITSDPLNELEYAGKQILKAIGGGIVFGF